MGTVVIVMVLTAALLHAGWNFLVKVQGDRLVVMATITAACGIFAAMALPFVPFPAPGIWPLILASLVLHNLYYLLLIAAYRYGELSLVYPVIRGTVPLAVTGLALVVLDEPVTPAGLIAVGLIAVGLLSLTTARDGAGRIAPRALLYAVATGLAAACYTLIDGIGVRTAASPHTYIFWLLALDGVPLALFAVCVRRRDTRRLIRAQGRAGLAAGAISLVSMWLFTWALALAPIPYVAALREVSMVFAVLLGVVVLKERLDLRKAVATAFTLTGTVLMKLVR